mgnify:FL=1
MILKSYELNKFDFNKCDFYLLYGENDGFKQEIIKSKINKRYKENIYRYDEKQIFDNLENFYNTILSNSFFENEKLIIISRATDKIKDIIEEVHEKNIECLKIIIISGILDKKSKLRNFCEKNKKIACVAFYPDNDQTLSIILKDFFKKKNITISQQAINLLMERCRGSRQSLKNEIEKIESFILNKKNINIEEILQLSNLSENYNATELIDNCLAKNQKKIATILNENNYSVEDGVMIIRIFLLKAKRLLKLLDLHSENNNADMVVSNFKPPIFWKEKEIVKQQLKYWSKKNVENLINEINEIELLIKKNSSNSINILSDFIVNHSKTASNYS